MTATTAVPILEPKRKLLLDAAFHEFGERGLAGGRLDDIAKRANVAKGTIYLYFPNKEALFHEMVRTTIIAALEQAETIVGDLEEDTAETQLRTLTIGWWKFLRSEQFQVVQRLVYAELHNFPDLMQFYVDEVIARGRRLISTIIARGTMRGEFREINAETAARMLSALSMMHSFWCARRQFFPALADTSDDEVRNEILEFYLRALRPDVPDQALAASSRTPL